MSNTSQVWIVAIHVFGIVLWSGGMYACLRLLSAHAAAQGAAEALSTTQRKTAVAMDIGATLAIISGLYLALAPTPSLFSGSGWLHAKLTLVVLGMLGLHGFTRAKVKKFSRGEVAALPGFVTPVFFVVVFGVIALAQVRPF
ncbi:MAG: protoporphyrinogen oxidase HemJ [Haliangiales bacterium]